jgi:hypothetical protein
MKLVVSDNTVRPCHMIRANPPLSMPNPHLASMRTDPVFPMDLTWIFTLVAFLAVACHALYDCPRPKCETCLPADIYDAPGVGFDLTPSYG